MGVYKISIAQSLSIDGMQQDDESQLFVCLAKFAIINFDENSSKK